MAKIVHLNFNSCTFEEQDHYFDSLSGIFDKFTENEIGCKLQNLYNQGIMKGVVYRNKLCTIKCKKVFRKRTNRKTNFKRKK